MMAKGRLLSGFAGLGLLVLPPALALGDDEELDPSAFERASVHFEQNATDGDVEVVFQVKGQDEGLATLRVVAPDGRRVVDFRAPDPSTLGIRQFEFESPEPEDVAGLKAAYPEGVYRFVAATGSGQELRGDSALSHALPATVSFVRPMPDADAVPAADLVIAWTPAQHIDAYIVEVENDDLDVSLEVRLPGSASSFAVPDGFLRAGTGYELGIGSVAPDGNVSFVETEFTTAE